MKVKVIKPLKVTKKYLVMFTAIFALSALLIILVTTDLFHQSPFERKNLIFLFLLIFPLINLIKLWTSYFRQK